MCFSVQVDKDIKKLATQMNAQVAIEEFYKVKSLVDKSPQLGMRIPTENDNNRVYPKYFAPILKSDNGKRTIYPMRYNLRPNGSLEDIADKYSLFNARLEFLDTKKTWKPLLGSKHGIIPIIRFYEWVEDENKKKKLISFFQQDLKPIWVPCLYDHWTSLNGELSYYSFAIITTDPNPEVLEMGHDRSPISMNEENIDLWLNEKNKKTALQFLNKPTETKYNYEWA